MKYESRKFVPPSIFTYRGGNFTLLRFAIVDTLYEAASVPGRTAMIYNDKSAQGLRGVLGFEIAPPERLF